MKALTATILTLGIFGINYSAKAEQACFEVQGMTCATCSLTLKSAVKRIKGVQDVIASVKKKNAIVQFEADQTNTDSIKKAIDDVGYKAIPKDCKKIEG